MRSPGHSLGAADKSMLCVGAARLTWGGAGQEHPHDMPMLFMPCWCKAGSLCLLPCPLVQALTYAVLALQRRCRRSWHRCRAAAAGCRGPARRGRPLHAAAARSAAARCTCPLGSSRGSSGRHRSAPATAAQAAAAGAAAPGEHCIFVLQLGRAACCSPASTACLPLCDAPLSNSLLATTRRHVGFEATPAEQTAAGQTPGAPGQARPEFRWDSDAARFGTTSMGYAREVAELFLGRNARASLDQV